MPKTPAYVVKLTDDEARVKLAKLKKFLKTHGGREYDMEDLIIDEYSGLIGPLFSALIKGKSLYGYPCCGTVR